MAQSVLNLLRREFEQGRGLADVTTMYDAARVIGNTVRTVAAMDREALEKDGFKFNVNFILGGQVKGEAPALYMIYPQGNPLQATEESPYLQIGETKYGRPILDRNIQFERTSLEEAAKLALLSLDSTMKSNVTVGPPIDLLAYAVGELEFTARRRFEEDDPDLIKMKTRWSQNLRQAVLRLPDIRLKPHVPRAGEGEKSIEVVEPGGERKEEG